MTNPSILFVAARLRYPSAISSYCFVALPRTWFNFGKNMRSIALRMINAYIALNKVVINSSSLSRHHLLARLHPGVGPVERRIQLDVWRVMHWCACCVRSLFIQVRNAKRTRTRLRELAKEKEWQTCSKCRRIVERIDGCLHMTCLCGFEFCYRCGAEYSGPGMCGH